MNDGGQDMDIVEEIEARTGSPGTEEVPNLSGEVILLTIQPIFNGQYSVVYHGQLGDKLVAVKVLKKISGADFDTMERKLRRERTVWAGLRHPNVLPLLGVAHDNVLFQPFGAFISPWRTNGNASEFLKARGKDLFPDQRLKLWKGVVSGVEYLHNQTPVLVHGDLKSANVLIDNRDIPQVCDFGLVSILLEEGNTGMTTASPHTGTDRYLAYELLEDAETVAPTTASDIFALGCIGLEVYFLRIPYAHRKNNMRGQIYSDIKAGKPPATPTPCNDAQEEAIWTLLDQCWLREPSKRPTARSLLGSLERLPQLLDAVMAVDSGSDNDSPRPEDIREQGIRILSFDSGAGPGAYAQLLFVKEYTRLLAIGLHANEEDVYPADYFDLMGGVGFGGLLAVMLGHLRMNVEEAINALVSIALAVFPYGAQKRDPETNMRNLRDAIEDLLQSRQISLDMKMNDKRNASAKCKVAIFAASSDKITRPVILRTYQARSSSLNVTVVDGLCATMAVQSFFSPVKIRSHWGDQSFSGGPLGANNPTKQLLKESTNLFGKDRMLAQIISMGSGQRRALSLDDSATLDGVSWLVEEISTDCEMVANELSTRLSSVAAYLRLNVDKGMETVSMDDWNTLGAIESHTRTYMETPAIAEAFVASSRRLKEAIGSVTLEEINPPRNIKVMAKAAPTLCPHYVLRTKPWEQMVLHLVETTGPGQKVFPVTGMAGCGKTQMVSYFLRKNQHIYNHVVFADASSQSNVKADLQGWARSLGDGHEKDVWEDGLRTLANGPPDGQWVLIFDDANPALDLIPFFPKCRHGTIIVTSRSATIGNLSNTYHLTLGPMEPEEAFSVLVQAVRREASLPPKELGNAYKLISELGRLALAMMIVGSYCHQVSSGGDTHALIFTFTKYLALFYSQHPIHMGKRSRSSLDEYQQRLYTVLDLSYQVIPAAAQDFLQFMSHFHHSGISTAMLKASAERSFEDPDTYLPRPEKHKVARSHLRKLLCFKGVWNEAQVQETIQTLRSFSLISTTTIEDSLFLHLHPLVQAWARDKTLSNAPDYQTMARQVLTSCSFEENTQIYWHLIPHINTSLQANKGRSLHINDQMAIGRVLKDLGHQQNAEALFAEALKT